MLCKQCCIKHRVTNQGFIFVRQLSTRLRDYNSIPSGDFITGPVLTEILTLA